MQDKTQYHNLGYIYAITSAVLFGASTPAAKYLLGEIDPWLLAGLLYLGSGLGLIVILVARHSIKKLSREANLTRNNYGWLAVTTLFGGIIGPVLLMFGLVKTEAATTSLLLNFESVLNSVSCLDCFQRTYQ